jgi:hypothetical protein
MHVSAPTESVGDVTLRSQAAAGLRWRIVPRDRAILAVIVGSGVIVSAVIGFAVIGLVLL